MQNLEWLSLTDIGYVRHLDDSALSGSELPDEPISSGTDSESEEDEDELIAGPSTIPNHVNGSIHHHDTDDWESDAGTDPDEERESEPHQREFVDPSSFSTNGPASWCTCNGYGFPTDANELGDDGNPIDRRKWRAWEKWVVRSCPRHSHNDNG